MGGVRIDPDNPTVFIALVPCHKDVTICHYVG